MGQVHRLVAAESAVIDKSVLTKLRLREGERNSRDAVDRMIFQATDKLCQIEKAIGLGERERSIELAKDLIQIGASSGMICLNDVAFDLMDCLQNEDRIATQAVLARLMRMGEDSLFALIDYTDRTMV